MPTKRKKGVVLSIEATAQRAVVGDIFRRPESIKVRSDVGVRRTVSKTVVLEPGSYFYLFSVTQGGGKFAVEATNRGVQLGSKSVDTAVATSGYRLNFKVLA